MLTQSGRREQSGGDVPARRGTLDPRPESSGNEVGEPPRGGAKRFRQGDHRTARDADRLSLLRRAKGRQRKLGTPCPCKGE
jgi:hypothetical protein